MASHPFDYRAPILDIQMNGVLILTLHAAQRAGIMDIGTRLKEVRKTLGFTQAEFAAMAGVKPNALAMYEAGKRIPRSTFLAHLSDHGIDVKYVLYGTSETKYAEKLTEDEESLIRSLRLMDPEAVRAIVLTVTAISAVRNLQDASRKEVDHMEFQGS